jgi:squalene-hopene/tetraprenyl-beta-curcumene cyclase
MSRLLRSLSCPALAALGLLSAAPAHAGVLSPATGPACTVPKHSPEQQYKGADHVRAAAARGLSYLSSSSQAWTTQHRCFGCHVQAVTMEALSVGKKHQYPVDNRDLGAMVRALKLGVTAGGHTTGIAFEGSAWARYDQWVGNNETDQLLRYAKDLLGVQAASGAINDDDRRLPVTGGTLQTTFQAAQTWRQAYARTADAKWLPPLRRAEGFLANQLASWQGKKGSAYIQDVNFVLLGLLASGVTRTEGSAQGLVKMLLARQNSDGGWGLDGQTSDAFATGQTVYALKTAGYSDEDVPVARAIRYLVSKQGQNGAWRTYRSNQGGADKAETMWAVLGMVTVDVASLSVSGLVDGQHVEPQMKLQASALDNGGGGIQQIELFVDDLPVSKACGAKLEHTLDGSKLSSGKHLIDLVAKNGKGQVSRRRFEVYAGEVYLTEVGARFDDATQTSVVSLRNIAPQAEHSGAVELEVFSTAPGGEAKPLARVYGDSKKGQVGGLSFAWNGKSSDGKALPRGRYVAKLHFRDAQGRLRQSESTIFVHDSEVAQQRSFAEVEGQISLRGGASSANTLVELVDDQGRVVQSTRTTDQGNYRFKTVDRGQYRVRVKKSGFSDLEQAVHAAPAAPAAKASLSW